MNEDNNFYITITAVSLIVFATIWGGCREYAQTEREYIKAGFIPQPTTGPAWGKPKQ